LGVSVFCSPAADMLSFKPRRAFLRYVQGTSNHWAFQEPLCADSGLVRILGNRFYGPFPPIFTFYNK
jgi:hypothetical protein